MGLNASKGNMYPWITHTWNTIKGACPHDCSYCYMKRFGKQKPARFDEKELKTDLGEGNFIFVGSSCDMFTWGTKPEWVVKTLEHCKKYDNLYLFQSKNPEAMQWLIGRFPAASQICTTIETNRFYPDIMHYSPKPEERAQGMAVLMHYMRLVTIEPILDFDIVPMVDLIKRCEPFQVNIGADSGGNYLPEPSGAKVLQLIKELEKFTKVVRKSNLERLIKG